MRSAIDITSLEIKQALEQFPQSTARSDCLGALAESVQCLEKFLDEWLWLPAEAIVQDDENQCYILTLGQIEEDLVRKSLIYKD